MTDKKLIDINPIPESTRENLLNPSILIVFLIEMLSFYLLQFLLSKYFLTLSSRLYSAIDFISHLIHKTNAIDAMRMIPVETSSWVNINHQNLLSIVLTFRLTHCNNMPSLINRIQ